MPLPTIDWDGLPRALGALEPVLVCGLPEFEAENEVVRADELRPIDMSWAVVGIKDQSTSSSCCGQAIAGCCELSRRWRGLSPLRFSPWFIYAQINGGVDQGAVISQGLTAVKLKGMAPEELVPYGTIRSSAISAGAYQAAMRFQLEKALRCNSYDAILNAVSRGFAAVFGIIVGRNFTTIDNDGYAGLPTRANALGGHAMYAVATRPSKRNAGDLDVKCVNSWGSSFGDRGTAWLERRHFDLRVDAFAVQTHESDEGDTEDDLPAE